MKFNGLLTRLVSQVLWSIVYYFFTLGTLYPQFIPLKRTGYVSKSGTTFISFSSTLDHLLDSTPLLSSFFVPFDLTSPVLWSLFVTVSFSFSLSLSRDVSQEELISRLMTSPVLYSLDGLWTLSLSPHLNSIITGRKCPDPYHWQG